MTDIEFDVLDDWFNYLESTYDINVDLFGKLYLFEKHEIIQGDEGLMHENMHHRKQHDFLRQSSNVESARRLHN
jgi:hypothetical protein